MISNEIQACAYVESGVTNRELCEPSNFLRPNPNPLDVLCAYGTNTAAHYEENSARRFVDLPHIIKKVSKFRYNV
jgi:hypothetical protein